MDNNIDVTIQDDTAAVVPVPELQAEKKVIDNDSQETDKKQRNMFMLLIRIIVTILIIAAGTLLILYIVARAAKYESIGVMIQSMLIELELMRQRVFY